MTKEKQAPFKDTKSLEEELKELILFNDDVNTFDFVIESLVEICEHDPEQAEQCAMVAHFKGKCAVMSGSYYELKPAYTEMTNRKLTVSIE